MTRTNKTQVHQGYVCCVQGECEKNPEYMVGDDKKLKGFCSLSCGTCTPAASSGTLTHYHETLQANTKKETSSTWNMQQAWISSYNEIFHMSGNCLDVTQNLAAKSLSIGCWMQGCWRSWRLGWSG